MRWLKRGLVALAVLAAVFVLGGLLLPDRGEVERSIVIERPPAQVYDAIDGFARFNEWSPWADYDDTARYRLSGPPRGVGARMEWSGEKGSGSQEVVLAIPHELVAVALDFGADGEAEARLILVPEGAGTRVYWRLTSMAGGHLAGRWFNLLLERLVGPDYERGLANLKRLLEAEPVAAPPPPSIDAMPAEEPLDPDAGEPGPDPAVRGGNGD